MAFSREQPKSGDTIMHCGHRHGRMVWFQYDRPIHFRRPDGSGGRATWFAACEPCYARHGEKVVDYVRGDGIWTGNAPVIEETVS